MVLMCYISSAYRFIFEAENAIFNEGKEMTVVRRSDASNFRAVSSRAGDIFRFQFCLSSASRVRIDDIRYSNDGHSDTFVLLNIDGKEIAKIETVQKFRQGNGWNDFVSLDKPLDYFVAEAGMHILSLQVIEADIFGVEIDNIVLSIDNKDDINAIRCETYCLNDRKRKRPLDGRSRGWIEQRSTKTICAEEDNINIPVYGADVKSVTITAVPPAYKSFKNNRNPDFTDCTMLTALWSFENIVFENEGSSNRHGGFHKTSIGPKHAKHKDGNVAALIAGINSKRMLVDIAFRLEGSSVGVVDADIGSVFHLTLKNVKKDVIVLMQYIGRSGVWSEKQPKLITVEAPHQTWDIPDFTWLENGNNNIKIEVHAWERHVEIEKIELRKRYLASTRAFHMYNDGENLVEGADIDFWWLVNKTMTVRILDTGETFREADSFRIYNRIPWTKHNFAQVFVIYQDGNIRILPYPPSEFDWIPFGSSVLIGQTDPSMRRPFASIKRIDILMKHLKLWIFFEDGGSVTLQIFPNLNQTVVKMTDIKFVKNRFSHPLLTFRSMWVANGNSDVEHVVADGENKKHIISNWHKLKGSSFEFYRKCISKHNTQSPDIVVDLRD